MLINDEQKDWKHIIMH